MSDCPLLGYTLSRFVPFLLRILFYSLLHLHGFITVMGKFFDHQDQWHEDG